jgi:hypothetical protein
VEQDPLYRQYLAQAGGGKTSVMIVPPYLSPSDETASRNGEGVQNFAANLRVFSSKGINTKYDVAMEELAMIEPGPDLDIKGLSDGTSNTIFFATKFATCGAGGSYYAAEPNSKWAAFFGQKPASSIAHPSDPTATFQLKPGPATCLVSPLLAQSFQTGGLSVALADGTVRMINPSMSAETWNRAMQPNDGKELASDWNE